MLREQYRNAKSLWQENNTEIRKGYAKVDIRVQAHDDIAAAASSLKVK